MGDGGPKFGLPLFNDPQDTSYKRSSKLPAKSAVAQTWKPFSWWIYVPWKREVKNLPPKHQVPKEPWETWSHRTMLHHSTEPSRAVMQIYRFSLTLSFTKASLATFAGSQPATTSSSDQAQLFSCLPITLGRNWHAVSMSPALPARCKQLYFASLLVILFSSCYICIATCPFSKMVSPIPCSLQDRHDRRTFIPVLLCLCSVQTGWDDDASHEAEL